MPAAYPLSAVLLYHGGWEVHAMTQPHTSMSLPTDRTLLLALAGSFTLLVLGAGCDGCSDPEAPASPCTTTSDCGTGLACIDGTCREPVDAGGRPDTGGGSDCVDADRDGRGVGCALGEDCDDTDPLRGGEEVCDGVDNDCNGSTDEGFADICAECTPSCEVTDHPGTDGWMPDEMNSDGVIVDDDGAITLGRTMTESFAVWVANMNDGTVSKLDSRTNRETARYPTTRPDAANRARPWDEACNWSNLGNCPSRTAVDQRFDAYVANRAFGNQGTVTKYGNQEEDCVDLNSDGVINTSRDVNGDGSIDMDPAAGEFIGPDDECLLWTVPVSGNNGVPRALAIGLAPPDVETGSVWVGLYNEGRACELAPTDGRTIVCMDIGGLRPYGAVADAMGRVWFADRSGSRRDILGFVDPSTMVFTAGAPVPDGTACATGSLQSYGVTVDGDGQLYVAMSNCNPSGVLRFEPATDTWSFHTIPGNGTPRGLAADETSLWVGISHNTTGFSGGLANHVEQYSLADMSHVATHTIPTGTGPVGVGVSFDGSVWAVCQGTNSAARLEPGAGTWIEHGVGLAPYTYSDFIGFGLNTFAQPRGWYRFTLEGCASGTNRWQGARYRAEVPPMTAVELWARTADSPAELAMQPWVGPFTGNPTSFEAPPGPLGAFRYIEVEIRMRTDDRRVAPRVFDIDVAVICEPIIG